MLPTSTHKFHLPLTEEEMLWLSSEGKEGDLGRLKSER